MVYVIGPVEGCYKIGRAHRLHDRLNTFSPLLPIRPAVVHSIQTGHSVWLESTLLRRLAGVRENGEWFRLSPTDLAALAAIPRAETDDDC